MTTLFAILEKMHIMSNQTSVNIAEKIKTFDLKKFLKNSFFDFFLPDSAIDWLGEKITGELLKHTITAVMLYKIFTPFRYLLTLTLTNIIIKVFKRQGKIPLQPPPGSSIKDLYKEQQQVIRRSLKAQREKYKNKRILFRSSQVQKPTNSTIFSDANRRKTL